MPPITDNELERRFSLHPATPITAPVMDANRAIAKEAARQFVKNTPESREQSLAVTALEEALFWANAAIARNGLTEGIERLSAAAKEAADVRAETSAPVVVPPPY